MSSTTTNIPSSSSTSTPNDQNRDDPSKYRQTFKSKGIVTKFVDPCAQAAKESMDCLNRNDYDRASCTDFFIAYRDCKKAWMDQRKDDRRAGRPSSIDI